MTRDAASGQRVTAWRWAWPRSVAVVGCVVVVVVAILTGIWMPADRWSALGQWVGGLGTVVAVAVALHIAQREATAQAERDRAEQTARELQQAQDAERERAEQAEREIQQARLVTAEFTKADPWEPAFEGEKPPDTVTISNHSGSVVLHPRVEGFAHPDGITIAWEVETEGPVWEYSGPASTLAAGERELVPVTLTIDPEPGATSDWKVVPIVGYTDAAGRRWRRTGAAIPGQPVAQLKQGLPT